MSIGTQFLENDQTVVFEAPDFPELNLARGSRITIERQRYEVTHLSAIVDSGGAVQLYYVEALGPKQYYEMDDELRYDTKMYAEKGNSIEGRPWTGA